MNKITDKMKLFTVLTLIAGSLIVSLWTLLRFFTAPIKYDLLGQQLLAHQWLSGDAEGSVIGTTNYVLKMIFLYMSGDLMHIHPGIFLVVSTILVNVVTFVGIYFVLRAILGYFKQKLGFGFNLLMLWLATIAGSVFWIEFTNSRNLEIVLGLLLVYVGLLFYKTAAVRRGALFLVLASLTYFSDPMQLFVTTLVLLVYVSVDAATRHREKWRELFYLIGLTLVGYALSLVLVNVVQQIFHTSFADIETSVNVLGILQNIPTIIVSIGESIFRLLSGTNEVGRWRQIINIAFVGILAIISVISLMKQRKQKDTRKFMIFIISALLVPVAVYAASGQALSVGDTSRYLIMIVPALVLLFTSIDSVRWALTTRRGVLISIVVVACVNTVSLIGATITHVQPKLSNEASIETKYKYLLKSKYQYGYASMDTTIPAMFLFGKQSNKVLLPLSCGKVGLRKANLFFDKNVFTKTEVTEGEIPIILDNDSIGNYPYTCSSVNIRKQLGQPVRTELYDGGTVLIYKSNIIKDFGFSEKV